MKEVETGTDDYKPPHGEEKSQLQARHTKQFFVQSFSQHLSPTVNTPDEDIAVNIFLP